MNEEQNINQLPNGWKWVKLKDISENIQYGYTESSSKEIVGPKFLRITDIQENKVNWDEVPYCKIDKETQKRYLLKDGDLVFARTGATVGKSFLIKGVIPEAVFASYLIRVRVSREINEKYLSNFFRSTIYWTQITEGQVGIGQPNVNGTKLGDLDLPLSPRQTQDDIVSKIEELFSELDKGLEILQTTQMQLKTYRQTVLKWAFEGKFSNKDLKEGELPEGWTRVKISEIAKIETGTTPSKSNSSFYGKEYPFYKPTDLEAGNNVQTSTDGLTELGIKAARFVPENSTLVTCIGATIGKTGYIKKGGGFNQQINAIVPNENMNPKFIYYQTIGLEFQKQILDNASATTLPIINKSKFQMLKMAICPIAEQVKIVEAIESRLSIADKMEDHINQGILGADALRQSILKKAFEGKLVNHSTNIESVNVLIEKIRINREIFLKEEKEREIINKALKIKTKKMPEELKTILEVLKGSNMPIDSKTLWQSCIHKDDIDGFYAQLKKHIEKGEIKELPRVGKESLLTITDSK